MASGGCRSSPRSSWPRRSGPRGTPRWWTKPRSTTPGGSSRRASQRLQIGCQVRELGLGEGPGVAHRPVNTLEQREQRRVATVVEVGRGPPDEAERRRVELRLRVEGGGAPDVV